ncbi:hypothetical protein F5888DRAFT_1689789 [Russula emetica]|nr:hypothetical protein F5888DRAFT_1689789 [Russula emetica]
MVALSPRFTFLATICTLAALSSAPVSDAAVLRLRASNPALANMAPGHWFRSHSSLVADSPPVLPLPKSPVESHKNSADSSDSPSRSGNKNDPKIPSVAGSHGEKDVSASDGNKGSSDDDDNVHEKGGKVRDRRWLPSRSITRLSKLWFGDNHVHYSRAPHHRHHHHHHHHDRHRRILGTVHHDRDPSAPGISAHDQNVVHPVARHHHHHHHHMPYEKVVVSGDDDHVHVGRSPHHNHHNHHNGYEKVVVSGDHDHVRVGRSPIPHHHPHHHGGYEKVIISGDHDHVRVDRSSDGHRGLKDEKVTTSRGNGHDHLQRSVFIAGEQGQSYVVARVAKRSATQKLFTLGKRAGGSMSGVPGRIDIMSPTDDVSGGKRIASLVLASSTSATSEDSATSPSAFVLNASDINGTQVYLLPSPSNSSKSMLTPDEIGVRIQLEMFDVTSASNVPYCATYDPDPPAPAPLTADECTEDPVDKRRSQLFAFDRTTRVVRPMWFNAQDSGKDECIDDAHRTAPQNASLPSVTGADSSQSNSTSSADRDLASNITVLTADPSHMTPSNESEGSIQRAQNVALIFVATNPEVMDTPADASTTVSSVLVTTTTAMASSSPGSLATSSSAAQVTSSSSNSASASTVPSAGSNTSVVSSGTLASVPSSTSPVSGAVATSSMLLGVQIIPESASQVASTTSSNATPTVTPVNTQPYDWMFYPDS